MEQLCLNIAFFYVTYVVITALIKFSTNLNLFGATKFFYQLSVGIQIIRNLYFQHNRKKVNSQIENDSYNSKQLIYFQKESFPLLSIYQFFSFFGFEQFKVSKNVFLCQLQSISIQQVNIIRSKNKYILTI